MALVILTTPGTAGASDFQRLYRSPSMLGRGGAGLAQPKGGDWVYVNPAGPNSDKDDCRSFFTFPLVDMSATTLDLLREKNSGARNERLASEIGEPYYARVSELTAYDCQQFALAFLHEDAANALVHSDPFNDGIETVDAGLRQSNVLSGGWRREFFPGLRIGAATHIIQRGIADFSAPVTNVDTLRRLKDIRSLRTASGVGVDVGAIYEVPAAKGLQVGIVGQNMGDTRLSKQAFSGPSLETLRQELSAGVSYQRKFGRVRQSFALDARDTAARNDSSSFKRMHAGGTSDLGIMRVHYGVNQGYATGGVSVGKNISLDLGTYAEETGETVGFRTDRRYFLQLGWRL